jgi:hypothetical protein
MIDQPPRPASAARRLACIICVHLIILLVIGAKAALAFSSNTDGIGRRLLLHQSPLNAITRPQNGYNLFGNNRNSPSCSKGFNYQSSRRGMALVPLPVEDVEELLVVGSPSGLQYATYWGRTKRETYNRLLESSIVAFVGVFFSYFLSFVIGGFVATLFGSLFAFWAVLSPDFKARQRNWEFLGGRAIVDPWMVEEGLIVDGDNAGLYGSLLLGRIDDVCVVENNGATEEYDLDDFQDYISDEDELEEISGFPYLIRMRVSDDEGRELQIHARLSEAYLGIETGMPAAGMLLSTSQTFSSLSAMSDIYIPDATCFVGDYPYLNRPGVEELFSSDDDLWNTLMSQADGDFLQI